MKILSTLPKGPIRDTFFTEKSYKAIKSCGELHENQMDRHYTKEELMEIIGDYDVILTGWGTINLDADIMEKANNLKILAHGAGSCAPVVSKALYDQGVKVICGNNVFARSVAEGCLCYILTSLRRIEEYSGMVRSGGWRGQEFYNQGLIGKKVGLVGFGAVARYFIELIRWFGVEVFVYDKYASDEFIKSYGATPASLNEIFENCEVISLHVSLTDETCGMINKELLSKIKSGAILVNTSRGAVIDEDALVEEAKTGRFLAALDVFTSEPLSLDSPLRTLKNVLPIPHMAGPTIDMREEVIVELSRDIKRYANNENLQNEVSYEYACRMTQAVTKKN